jgi:hypothetical protein
MTQYFFSVDVETSSTNPFTGELLSLAIIPIRSDTWEILDGKHWALEYNPEHVDADTVQWWSQQNKEAYEAAWGGLRTPVREAAAQICGFVCSFAADIHDRVFCANPASFDWAWVEKLFSTTPYNNPFSHRTLCMRNVLYGAQGGKWGNSRYKEVLVNYPEIPHHAYHDALAQAKDLVSIMSMVNSVKDAAEIDFTPPVNKKVYENMNIFDDGHYTS